MLLLEALFKFGSISLLVVLGLMVARDCRDSRALRFSLPLIVAMCFMFLTTGSPELALSSHLAVPLRLFDCLNTVFIWWLGLALFDDDFELGVREWLISGAFALLAIYLRIHYMGFGVPFDYALVLVVSLFSFSLMMHLCYIALIGRKEDLVEQRRRIRVYFVVAVALVAGSSTVAERIAHYVGRFEQDTIWITYFFTLPIAAWAMLWLGRLHPEVLIFDTKQPIEKSLADVSDRDKATYSRLLEVMQQDKVFVRHGFSIGDLATELEIPPHQLRKLINQSMGYRNFSSFLNKYRIAEVKQALSDPDKARTPILTLAMEAGFSSLAPFNRAFRASEGVTPTDFRNQALAKSLQHTEQN